MTSRFIARPARGLYRTGDCTVIGSWGRGAQSCTHVTDGQRRYVIHGDSRLVTVIEPVGKTDTTRVRNATPIEWVEVAA